MTAIDVLREAEAANVRVWAVGDHIRYQPIDAAPELVARLRDHKAELLAMLARREERVATGMMSEPRGTPQHPPAPGKDGSADGLPAFHRDLFTTVRETMGADAALDLLPSLVLGARLASGEVEALWCGINECRCVTCRGIPCRGSAPWGAAPGEKNVRGN